MTIAKHALSLSSKELKQQPSRRLPLVKREEIDCIIQDKDEEKEGVIKRSSNEWASTRLLVYGKDGSTGFCVDYLQFNNFKKKENYL